MSRLYFIIFTLTKLFNKKVIWNGYIKFKQISWLYNLFLCTQLCEIQHKYNKKQKLFHNISNYSLNKIPNNTSRFQTSCYINLFKLKIIKLNDEAFTLYFLKS